MKKQFLFVLILFMGCAVSSFAQQKKPETVTIKTPNMRCWVCKQRLLDYMAQEISSNQSGIIKMNVNMLSGTTSVQFWPDRTNANAIRTSFNNAGFDADDMKATEDAYKLLPPACKRNEEGGGQKKGAKPCHIDPSLM